MSRRMSVRQPFDLALSLEMGQAFRWRRVGDEEDCQGNWGEPPALGRGNCGGWYSGVLGEYLVHLRQTEEELEYRVGGEDGEGHDVDLDRHLHDYFRLDDEIGEVYARLGRHRSGRLAARQSVLLRTDGGRGVRRPRPWQGLRTRAGLRQRGSHRYGLILHPGFQRGAMPGYTPTCCPTASSTKTAYGCRKPSGSLWNVNTDSPRWSGSTKVPVMYSLI